MDEFITNFFDIIQNKYAAFDGRARRKEFWMFVAVNFVIGTVAGILGSIRGVGWIFNSAYGLFSLAIFIPQIALAIRRMHDVGKSGWFCLITLVPIIGWIIYLVFAATEGNVGDNAYGPDPKAEER